MSSPSQSVTEKIATRKLSNQRVCRFYELLEVFSTYLHEAGGFQMLGISHSFLSFM